MHIPCRGGIEQRRRAARAAPLPPPPFHPRGSLGPDAVARPMHSPWAMPGPASCAMEVSLAHTMCCNSLRFTPMAMLAAMQTMAEYMCSGVVQLNTAGVVESGWLRPVFYM